MTTLSRWRDRWRRWDNNNEPRWLTWLLLAILTPFIVLALLLAGHASPGG